MAHLEGYTSHEPHGYFTGDYPHGGVVTEDHVDSKAPIRGKCGFRLWRTPPATGSLTPGYVLC
jgi:hypothetical protein